MKSATAKCKVFLDSSALFAGIFSAKGGARFIGEGRITHRYPGRFYSVV